MLNVGRRQVLAGIGAIPIAGLVCPRRAAAQAKPLKVLLNSSFSGPQAFFFLADEQGYLRQEGLEVEFFPGDGAAAVVPRIVPEGFDAGYGDLNALIELVARDPAQAPIAVYTTFNWTPLTIAVAADGPIKSPKDLEGRTINSHPDDAALRAFPALANVAGIDPAKVTVVTSDVSMRELAEDTIAGKTAGTFGFVNTIIAALASGGIDGRKSLRFIEYRDYLPDLYGNTLMVTRTLAANNPEAVRGLVRAVNLGLADTVKDLDTAIEAVAKHNPKINKAVDRARLAGTFEIEMSNPEGRTLGIGDVDDARLARSIAIVAETYGLPRVPDVKEIFSHDFLPPTEERVTSLAK